MIKGIHGLVYGSNADEMRDFFRDKLKLPFTDVGHGWLIFDLQEGDIGFHPTEGDPAEGTHQLSFYTDDLEATVKELKANGVQFKGGIEDQRWGRVTHIQIPGGHTLMLYQPRYTKKQFAKEAAGKKRVAKKVAARKPAAKKKPVAKKTPAAKKRPARRTAAPSKARRGR